jgi:hypothetical protein
VRRQLLLLLLMLMLLLAASPTGRSATCGISRAAKTRAGAESFFDPFQS